MRTFTKPPQVFIPETAREIALYGRIRNLHVAIKAAIMANMNSDFLLTNKLLSDGLENDRNIV